MASPEAIAVVEALLLENEQAAQTLLRTSQLIREKCGDLGIDVPDMASVARGRATLAASQDPQKALREPLLAKEKPTPERAPSQLPPAESVRQLLNEKQVETEDLYSDTGLGQAIARDTQFQSGMMLVIMLNSIWIGIATDCNKAELLTDAPLWIQVGENAFCLVFTFEIAVRFLAYRTKRDAFTDCSFMFDFVLVAFMVYETWIEVAMAHFTKGGSQQTPDLQSMMILRIFRLGRLFRIARIGRIARLLRSIPELAILARALLYALRSVGATMVLLIIGIYVFAIYFTQMLSGSNWGADNSIGAGQFDNVILSMHTLMVQGILNDQGDLINGLLEVGLLYYFVILLYMLIATQTIANMVIGVICDLIGKISDTKRDEMLKEDIQSTIGGLLFEFDTDGDRLITEHEFALMLKHEKACKLLHSHGVDVLSLLDFSDMIFEDDDKELSFKDFMDIVLGFRDEDPAVKRELAMKRYMKEKLELVEQRIKSNGAK